MSFDYQASTAQVSTPLQIIFSPTLNSCYTPMTSTLLPLRSLSLSRLSFHFHSSPPNLFNPSSRCPCLVSNAVARKDSSKPLAEETITGSEYDDDEDEDDDGGDFEWMEKDAREAVREYSRALARELAIDDDSQFKGRGGKPKAEVPKHIPDRLLPLVAIVGRPNVGKSALFNRLVGSNKAIVVDEPGVTRDRLYGRSFWQSKQFMVVDTGGVMTLSKSQEKVMEDLQISTTIGMEGIPMEVREMAVARMPSMIEKQAVEAVEEADVVIFVVDGKAGLVAADMEIADWLRKRYSHKHIILAVNKCESPKRGLIQSTEFWSLGFSPLPISAISGTGTGELLTQVCSHLKDVKDSDLEEYEFEEEDQTSNRVPSISIVGRPNVGKSSILNALVGENRTIVSPISGTTRDAIDTEFTGPDGQKYKLIDTAGIRRRAAIVSGGSTTESLSVNRAFRAIRRSDVVALIIEALACITEQDCRIGERIDKEGKGCVIVVNKWDTIPNKNQQSTANYEEDVRQKLRTLKWAPIVYCTATSGHSVDTIVAAAGMVEKERSRRLGTSIINQVIQEAIAFKAPPRTRGGKRGRVYYTTQAAVRPPTFVFFVNDSKLFPETYRRYMEKQLRANAGFPGTPIRLLWRSRRRTDNKGKSLLERKGASSKLALAA